MHVLIYSDRLSFPNGYAATHYIHLVAKGLIEAGANCYLLIPRGGETTLLLRNLTGKGEVEGIQFEYATGTPFRPSSFFIRRWLNIKARLIIQFRLLDRFLRKKLDVIHLYSWSWSELKRIYPICRLLGIPIILHLSEWQPGFSNITKKEREEYEKFYALAKEKCAGFIVISRYLESMLRTDLSEYRNNAKIIYLPILIDEEKWKGIIPLQGLRPFCLFCADLINYTADALFIMEAFEMSSIKSHDLIIIGRSNSSTISIIMDKADKLKIRNQLVLQTEFIEDTKLKSMIKGADALLLPLWDDDRSRARFPFKLGDYLLSGKPVVACGVGEINTYLEDSVSAYIAKADDSKYFGMKIKQAIENQNSSRIGMQGRKIAIENFNYRYQGKRLYDFIDHMIINS